MKGCPTSLEGNSNQMMIRYTSHQNCGYNKRGAKPSAGKDMEKLERHWYGQKLEPIWKKYSSSSKC